MTDRELTPPEEERVRRLLAQARHDEPMPPEIVARLDGVLRSLAAEPVVGSPNAEHRAAEAPTGGHRVVAHGAPVVDLSARRRRRRATSLLVAAAAVTVIGVGLPPVLRGMTTGASDSAGSASKADLGTDGDAAPEAAGGDRPDFRLKGGPAPRISAERFDLEVAELSGRAYAAVAPSPARTQAPDVTEAPSSTRDQAELGAARCPGGVRRDLWGEGDLLAVRYDGRRGVLVFRAPEGDAQQVDLFLCGETAPTRSTVVPVP